MNTVQSVIKAISRYCTELIIAKAYVGYIYSSVQLENQATGVAYTFPKSEHCRHKLLDSLKPLRGRSALELISFLGDQDLTASSLALAAVNAVITSEKLAEAAEPGDILDELDIRSGDQVCMVGCFLPLIKPLESRQVKVVAFDELPKPGSHNPDEAGYVIPNSQIAIITATAIINDTIDHLLEIAQSCREVAILGPSTPLLISAFLETPVTCLSGVQIEEPELVQQIIAEGGGFREFKQYMKKLNMRIRAVK